MSEKLSLLDKKVVCCKNIEIQGVISFGTGCRIHPNCTIISEGETSIIFGDYNIVEEGVTIINKPFINAEGNEVVQDMYIGNYNLFEVGSQIESSNIGSYNVFEHKSKVLPSSTIGDACIVGAAVKISGTVPNTTAVFGENKMRKNWNSNIDLIKKNIVDLAEILYSHLTQYNSVIN